MKVSIEQLEFPSSIKDKILKLKDISKLHIDFIGGKYIHFEILIFLFMNHIK